MKFFSSLAALGIFTTASLCGGQTTASATPDKIEFSNCRAAQSLSPDGKWRLTAHFIPGACPPMAPATTDTTRHADASAHGNNWGIELTLEETSTHVRRSVPFAGYSGEAAWSPSGKIFFVNDHAGSNVIESSLFFADSLRKIDLGTKILHADQAATRFANAHSYFIARQWIAPDTVLVQFCGHTDNFPSKIFDLRYSVNQNGQVRRLSRKIRLASEASADSECKP